MGDLMGMMAFDRFTGGFGGGGDYGGEVGGV
jgi:hypothetical protein